MAAEPLKTPTPRLARMDDEAPEPVPVTAPDPTPVSLPEPPPTALVPSGTATLAQLMDDLREAERTKARLEEFSFQLVIFPETRDPQVETHATLGELIARMKALSRQGTRFLTLFGELWGISRGKFKYLVSPANERFPLFDETPQLQIDPFGSLHADDDVMEAPGDSLGEEEEAPLIEGVNASE